MSDAVDLLPPPPVTPVSADAAQMLRTFAGVQTVAAYAGVSAELAALTSGAGVFDQGWRSTIRIEGADRVRWLNGMVTNAVSGLPAGRWNESFLLNAQGRIQGHVEVYAGADALWLVTDQDQLERVFQHLDRFIIMDEVEMSPERGRSALGLAGPTAAALLGSLWTAAAVLAPYTWLAVEDIQIARGAGDTYTLRCPAAHVPQLWQRLLAAGAMACGLDAIESLRVLAGRPRYGVDIEERHLAQETGQMHLLNFNKGCYLGQEIVERVRSRANLHRSIRSLRLDGAAPEPGTLLHAGEAAAGQLSSITTVNLPGLTGTYALGTVRAEAAAGPLLYAGGTATVLSHAPLAAALAPGA